MYSGVLSVCFLLLLFAACTVWFTRVIDHISCKYRLVTASPSSPNGTASQSVLPCPLAVGVAWWSVCKCTLRIAVFLAVSITVYSNCCLIRITVWNCLDLLSTHCSLFLVFHFLFIVCFLLRYWCWYLLFPITKLLFASHCSMTLWFLWVSLITLY